MDPLLTYYAFHVMGLLVSQEICTSCSLQVADFDRSNHCHQNACDETVRMVTRLAAQMHLWIPALQTKKQTNLYTAAEVSATFTPPALVQCPEIRIDTRETAVIPGQLARFAAKRAAKYPPKTQRNRMRTRSAARGLRK